LDDNSPFYLVLRHGCCCYLCFPACSSLSGDVPASACRPPPPRSTNLIDAFSVVTRTETQWPGLCGKSFCPRTTLLALQCMFLTLLSRVGSSSSEFFASFVLWPTCLSVQGLAVLITVALG
jgi:hypothetical protein